MKVTFQGNPVTLRGKELKQGDKMPDFRLYDNGLNLIKGANLSGTRVFVVVPSLDTGVCDMEVRKFNEKAAELSGVSILVVSMDLPFAQARWCGANGIGAVQTLSDYNERSFGEATGTFIEEIALLTRAVFIVNRSNEVVYAEYVPEITNHPNYDRIYAELASCIK